MVMKKYLVIMFILALSGLVVAESSEISTNFNIPSVSFWDVYGAYIIGAIIILIVIIYLKGQRSSVKKIKRKRRAKRKK